MPTTYRTVHRDTNIVTEHSDPYRVSIFLLGRCVDSYIVIKSDEVSDRVVKFDNYEVNAIERQLANA